MILFIVPLYNSALATTDLTTLASPDITISPSTGSPGTTITITVSNLPDISNESYPYPDLYIYLPFSKPFGVSVSSHCGGEDCFPIYTYDDALKKNFADRTISFSLFSTNNPAPVFLNGYENSVCDVIINGKTVERFSTLCNTKEEPSGAYQIKLVWALESNLEQRSTAKTVQFSVISGSSPVPKQIAETGNAVIKKYQSGTINGTEFVNELRAIGWNDEQIRQALAVIGKLPHQMGSLGPDNTQDVLQDVNGPKQSEVQTGLQPSENNTQQINEQIAASAQPKEDFSEKTNSSSISYQSNIPSAPQQNNAISNFTIIGLSIAVAVVVVAVIFIFKKKPKNIHQT
jgi:hypothetical protein